MCTAILTIYRAILHPTPYTTLISSLSSSPIYRPYKPYSLIQQPQTTDSNQLLDTPLHFIALHCTALFCTEPYCTILHCKALNTTQPWTPARGRRSVLAGEVNTEIVHSPPYSIRLQTPHYCSVHNCRLQPCNDLLTSQWFSTQL